MILHTLIIHYNVGIMSRDLPSQLPSHFLTKMSSHKTLPWLTCTQKFMANGWIRRQSLKRHFTIFLPLFALTKPSSMLTGHGIGIAPLLLNMKGFQMWPIIGSENANFVAPPVFISAGSAYVYLWMLNIEPTEMKFVSLQSFICRKWKTQQFFCSHNRQVLHF